MIVQAFLRWAETAGASERSKAADALARAFLKSEMDGERNSEVHLALTWLLDDPSPRVRLALAEALADSPHAPRAVIVALAEDQPEIACAVLPRSPVLEESDLVDLAARGTALTRALIAARTRLGRCAAAALAEIGDATCIAILLENVSVDVPRFSLRRIAERYGADAAIRDLLLSRRDLPADARHMLVEHVRHALAGSGLLQGLLAQARINHLTREAAASATVAIAGEATSEDSARLVEHLRVEGHLTPALLMHTLCSGKLDFFADAIFNLSGLEEKRVRSILATGRTPAVKALFRSAGLDHDISEVFVEATLLWRRATQASAPGMVPESISGTLVAAFRDRVSRLSPVSELLDMVEKLHLNQQRQSARKFVSNSMAIAA